MNKTFYLRDLNVKRLALGYLSNLPTDAQEPLIVEIRPYVRTKDQNSALWPLLQEFADQLDWPVNGERIKLYAEDWKDLLSAAFHRETQRVAMGLDGGMVMLGMRTSKMGKKEFSDFLEFIHAVAADRGVKVEREAA